MEESSRGDGCGEIVVMIRDGCRGLSAAAEGDGLGDGDS